MNHFRVFTVFESLPSAGAPRVDIETSLVALTFSAALRLRQAFFAEASGLRRQALLFAAGDLVDKTIPSMALKREIADTKPNDALDFLIERRAQVAAVPPGLWRKDRVAPNELGEVHYPGLRAVLRALRKDFSAPDKLWPILEAWLAPAWAAHPQLQTECVSLKNLFPSEALVARRTSS